MPDLTERFLSDPLSILRASGQYTEGTVFGAKTLFTSDPEFAYAVLSDKTGLFSGKVGNREVATALFGTSLLYEDGGTHARLRKALSTSWKIDLDRTSKKASRATTQQLIEYSSHQSVSALEFFHALNVRITLDFFFNVEIDLPNSIVLSRLVDRIGHGLFASSANESDALFHSGKLAREALDKRYERFFPEGVPLAYNALSKSEFFDHITTLLFAGADTGSATISWIVSNQAAIDRIRNASSFQEVRSVIDRSLLEKPPVYFIPRGVTRDGDFEGRGLDKGSHVYIMVWDIHKDAQPIAAFNQFIPFGAGPKKCPGQAFAYCSISAVLTAIASSWSVQLEGGDWSQLGFVPGLRPANSPTISFVALEDGDEVAVST